MPGIVIHTEGGDMKFAAVPAYGAVAEERKPWRRPDGFKCCKREDDIAGGQKGGNGNVITIPNMIFHVST